MASAREYSAGKQPDAARLAELWENVHFAYGRSGMLAPRSNFFAQSAGQLTGDLRCSYSDSFGPPQPNEIGTSVITLRSTIYEFAPATKVRKSVLYEEAKGTRTMATQLNSAVPFPSDS